MIFSAQISYEYYITIYTCLVSLVIHRPTIIDIPTNIGYNLWENLISMWIIPKTCLMLKETC